MKLQIEEINRNGSTQARVELNEDIVLDYCEKMERGVQFPRPIVFEDGYWLADGHHSVAAHDRLGHVEIEVDIRKGGLREAIKYAASANAEHGLQRTPKDKRRAVSMILDDPEWSRWSDNAIAQHCGVSADLVGSVRRELSSIGQREMAKTLVHRNGSQPYLMDTSKIGRTQVLDPQEMEDLLSSFDAEKLGKHPIIDLTLHSEFRADDVAKMDGEGLAMEKAVLLIRIPFSRLADAEKIAARWGFSKQGVLVVDKKPYIPRKQWPLVLLATRGHEPLWSIDEVVEGVYGAARGIQLFAMKRSDWDTWGIVRKPRTSGAKLKNTKRLGSLAKRAAAAPSSDAQSPDPNSEGV